jgi:hypothetical protein
MKKYILLIALSLGIAVTASAETTDMFITHGGCRIYIDGRDLDETVDGVQSIEMWLYLNQRPVSYSPDFDTRAVVYTEHSFSAVKACHELYFAYENKRLVTFELEDHFISSWDTKIVRGYKYDDQEFQLGLTYIHNFSYKRSSRE